MSTKLYDISSWCRKGLILEDYPYLGEVKSDDLHVNENIKIGNVYYSIGVLDMRNKSVGIRSVNINFNPEDRDYEENLICPYCGYEDEDSWELSDEDEEYICSRCGAVISYQRVVTVKYSSSPVKSPDVINSEWLI